MPHRTRYSSICLPRRRWRRLVIGGWIELHERGKMTVMPNAPEVSSPPSVKSTTRFGARAVLAAVALALVAVPGALILLLVEDKWAPLLRADDGAHLSPTSNRIRAPGTATRASAT